MNEKILVSFGKKVRYLRQKNNLSQEELAFRTGLHRTYIGMIERAEKNISLLSMKKIADAFGISLKSLIDFEEL